MSFLNLVTAEISALWSALYFKKELQLPSPEKMEEELKAYIAHYNKVNPASKYGCLCKA